MPALSAPLHWAKRRDFFGGAVLKRFDDRAIEDEGRLRNLGIREHFLTRIFAFSRLRQMQQSASMSELVRFHAANKLLLMAYNQTKMRELGRIVANGERKRANAVIESYGEQFRIALKKAPRHASPINALMHALGYFKKELSTREAFSGRAGVVSGRKGAAHQRCERNWVIGNPIRIGIFGRTISLRAVPTATDGSGRLRQGPRIVKRTFRRFTSPTTERANFAASSPSSFPRRCLQFSSVLA